VSNLLPKGEFASQLRQMTESGAFARSRQCVLVVSIDDIAAFKRSRGKVEEEAIASVARALLRSPSGTAMAKDRLAPERRLRG
jgi:hypothetical protein